MKHTKLLVVALLVALLACLSVTAMAGDLSKVNCDHRYTYPDTIKAPGCETKGLVGVTCYECGLVVSYVEIDPVGHTWGDWVIAEYPTCGKEGTRTSTCEVCGHIRQEKIPVNGLPHTWVTVEGSASPATCVADGVKASKVCSVCGLQQKGAVDPATGHDFNGVEWVPFGDNSTCQYHGHLRRACANGCGYFEYKELPLVDHNWSSDPILPAKANSCTTNGCKAVYECVWCGAQKGGDVIPATGHNFGGQTWLVASEPTCQTNGKLYRVCANGCGAKEYMDAPKIGHAWAATPILPAKAATCETTGCTAVYQCTTPGCGATKGGDTTPALGHVITEWGWLAPDGTVDYSDKYATTCEYTGTRVGICAHYADGTCNLAKGMVKNKIPAYGHSAQWRMVRAATPDMVGIYELWCTRCNDVINTVHIKYGEKAPTGSVNTGAAASTNTVAANVTKVTSETVGKNPTSTKTATAKTSTKSTTSSASTKTAAAPATTETKKVVTVAAVAAAPAALEDNQAQLVADKHLYVVKNVAGEEIVLTVNVADGKITVEANLAEGESLVLYANAEAIEAPTAENTLVLTANEAVELPEAFANAIVAVVKTESLPTAVAAK